MSAIVEQGPQLPESPDSNNANKSHTFKTRIGKVASDIVGVGDLKDIWNAIQRVERRWRKMTPVDISPITIETAAERYTRLRKKRVRYFGVSARFAIVAGLLYSASAGILAACSPESTETPAVTQNVDQDSSGDSVVDQVLAQLIAKEVEFQSAQYTANNVFMSYRTIPFLESANGDPVKTQTQREQWDRLLDQHVQELGPNRQPLDMLIQLQDNNSVERISFYTVDGTVDDGLVADASTDSTVQSADEGAEKPGLYFWRRMRPDAAGELKTVGAEEKSLVTAVQTHDGRMVWYSANGTVLQYTTVDGKNILFPLSDSPIYLNAPVADNPDSTTDLRDARVHPWENIDPFASVAEAGIITPAELSVDLSTAEFPVVGTAFEEVQGVEDLQTVVFLNDQRMVVASWNPESLRWDVTKPDQVVMLLTDLGYPVVPGEAYAVALSIENKLVVVHGDGTQILAVVNDGAWSLVVPEVPEATGTPDVPPTVEPTKPPATATPEATKPVVEYPVLILKSYAYSVAEMSIGGVKLTKENFMPNLEANKAAIIAFIVASKDMTQEESLNYEFIPAMITPRSGTVPQVARSVDREYFQQITLVFFPNNTPVFRADGRLDTSNAVFAIGTSAGQPRYSLVIEDGGALQVMSGISSTEFEFEGSNFVFLNFGKPDAQLVYLMIDKNSPVLDEVNDVVGQVVLSELVIIRAIAADGGDRLIFGP